MGELNQYALSQALGSKMKPMKAARFGNFALPETTAESLRARELGRAAQSVEEFTYDHDRVVAQAFEDVRKGASPDALLWNRPLVRIFAQRCRELGLDSPEAILNRRVLNIRKNKSRYEKHGIRLSPTTQDDPHPSILPQYAHVVEFALVRLRYRYGASIHDILLDSALGDQFERLALEIAPQLSPQDLRLAALNLRKSRFLKKQEKDLLTSLDPAVVDRACEGPILLAEVKLAEIPDAPGLIELREADRYLYISKNENLRPTIAQFTNGQAFATLTSDFWHPELASISLQFVPGEAISNIAISKWELRLIAEREPVFNWPIHKPGA